MSALRITPVALLLAACTIRDPPSPRERLASELERVRAALGEPHPTGSRHLKYRARVDGEAWTQEIVVSPLGYAERRTRGDGASFALGLRGATPWVRTAARPAVEVDGDWASDARLRHALFAHRFARPGARDSAEMMPSGTLTWELSYRAEGAATLGVRIDRETALPTTFDWVDGYDRIQRCDDLRWARRGEQGGLVLEHMRCAGIVHEIGRHVTLLDLEEADWRRPDWAEADPLPLAKTFARVDVPIEVAHRVRVPLEAAGVTANMILDSGAGVTTLSESAALALGAVPTGEPPIHFKPPWLAESVDWVGLIDRVEIGGMAIHGMRVLVGSSNLGDGDGLLGFDFFRKAIVDIDSPRHTLRLWAHDTFTPPAEATAMPVWGTSHEMWTVKGDVSRVGEGLLILDTGAPLDVVVHHPRMAIAYPRHPGEDMQLAAFEQEVSPDYVTEIDGMRIGPFPFDRMPAYGRDRERQRLGQGFLGLVGMGLMRHFRVAFDARAAQVYLTPGDGYDTLRRTGLELEDRDGRAVVTRIVPRSPASGLMHLHTGDAITSVNGKKVKNSDAALAAFADADGPAIRFAWESWGARRSGLLRPRD
jgi:hypothetical protein